MESIYTSNEKLHHRDKLTTLQWKEQIQYIVKNAIENDDHVLGEYLVANYSINTGRSFYYDHNRYIHDYLSNLTIYQAILLYDNIFNKDNFIAAIKIDHPHLNQLIEIHNHLQLSIIDAESNLPS